MTHKKPSAAQLRSLRALQRRHGRTWKAALRRIWATGYDGRYDSPAPGLMPLRNTHGRAWLATFKFPAAKPSRTVKRAVSRKRRSPPKRRVRA